MSGGASSQRPRRHLPAPRVGPKGADTVANGRLALEALRRQNYDVILMDLQMPEMDGFEATRRIREDAEGPQPFIVAVTAHAMLGDRERCLASGMDDYLSKPVQIESLQATLQRILVPKNKSQTGKRETIADVI